MRNFRRLGRVVEVQNYLDDTGVQVADVVVALEHPDALVDPKRAAALGEEIREILGAFPYDAPGVPGRRLGDLAWDLYALVGRSYAADPELEKARRDTLHAIEGAATGHDQTPAEKETAALAARLAEAVVRCHLLTMERIGVDYDLLPRESDILGRKFWVNAFERLKAAGAARLEADGKNAGCWVMPLEGAAEFEGMEDADKVLVRSNGTVTYTGKDVAYQLWKLGRPRDRLRVRESPLRGRGREPGVPRLGRRVAPLPDAARRRGRGRLGPRTVRRSATGVINVIDVRQSYPQKVVKEAVRKAGFPEAADRSVHFSYEMVALTPASAEALGVDLTDEDRARPFVEMSGRKGLGVKADDLLDRLVEKARDQIASRAAGERPEPGRAESIAVGALRVYMTRFSRNKIIAFDFDEALAFEGDTGPYLQYAAVRAANIFRKLEETGLAGRLDAAETAAVAALPARDARRRALGRRADVREDPRHLREGRRDARGLAPREARARGRRGVPPPLPHAPDLAGEGRGAAARPPRGPPGRLRPPRGRPRRPRRPDPGEDVTTAREVKYRDARGHGPARARASRRARLPGGVRRRAGDAFAREADAVSVIFEARRALCVTAETGGQDVGVVLVLPGGGPGEAAVFTWLAVDGALRGCGIGRELLFRGIEACRERGRHLLRAHAFAVSPAACRLYWLYGFRVAGLEAFPVASGVRERIVFEKRLDLPPATA